MKMADCTLERLLKSNTSRAVSLLSLVSGLVCLGANLPTAPSKVTSVHFWSLGEATRVSIEVSADFTYHAERLSEPDRIFFDVQGARPQTMEKAMHVIQVGDPLIKQIRVAETQPGITRVVLDLEAHRPGVEFTASQLSHPDRLIVELKLKDKPAPPSTGSVTGTKTIIESAVRAPEPDLEAYVAAAPPALGPRKFQAPFLPQIESETINAQPEWVPFPANAVYLPLVKAPLVMMAKALPPPGVAPSLAPSPSVSAKITKNSSSKRSAAADPQPLPAKLSPTGDESLTRVLGLKLGRVVIDPGHGGIDIGTHGPAGVFEKDVVLDVSKRLAVLLQTRLQSEVVFTRDDDTYIPLQERTRIANEHKADLFLSIHANSSPVRTVSGVETYYLNFTTSKTAMDLAARENASSEASIFDLKDTLQKIAMKDKIDESREFASRIQTSLYTISAKTNAATKNRGIKKAPFVVLIGASMPSVLAEIGFLTNGADEALLARPDHRQKIAEALYKGIAAYADTLSHFQVASR